MHQRLQRVSKPSTESWIVIGWDAGNRKISKDQQLGQLETDLDMELMRLLMSKDKCKRKYQRHGDSIYEILLSVIETLLKAHRHSAEQGGRKSRECRAADFG